MPDPSPFHPQMTINSRLFKQDDISHAVHPQKKATLVVIHERCYSQALVISVTWSKVRGGKIEGGGG